MPYDPNGFNYQGNSITSLYDTTLATNSNVKSSGFTKNGTDLATLISPATYHDYHGSSKGTITSGTYTGFGSNQISFDNAFSDSTKLKKQARISVSSHTETWNSDGYNCARFNNSSGAIYIYMCMFDSSGAAKSRALATSVHPIQIVIVGGGGGGKMAYLDGYGSGGPGGGGGGAVVYGTVYPHPGLITYGMNIGSGGNGQTSWTSSLAGYNAYDGGDTKFYPDNYSTYYSITAKGGAHGRYINETASTAEGSTAGAAPSGSDIGSSFNADSLNGTGYRLGISTSITSTTNFSIHNMQIYRNKGGNSTGYGWSGGGGGGAGGAGGVMHGEHNREGGDGGSSINLLGRSWAGGGGGGGDAATQSGFANGNHGGGNADGYGGGGNSTGRFTGTSDGKNGGIAIGVSVSHYEIGF
jgi:hypothetical protein